MLSRVRSGKYLSSLSTPSRYSSRAIKQDFSRLNSISSYSFSQYSREEFLKQNPRVWEQKRNPRTSTNSSEQQGPSSSSFLLSAAIVGALFAAPIILCASSDSDDSQAITVADRLYAEDHKRECLDYLEKYFENKQGNVSVGVLWRLSRVHFDISTLATEMHEEDADFRYHVGKAHEIALKAIKICETDPESAPASERSAAYRMAGVSVSLAKAGDSKTNLQNTFAMRDFLLKAIEENSKDPHNYFFMGLWATSAAGLSWPEKKVYSFFYGPPPEASYEEALKYFLRAEELEPGFSKSNRVMICSAYEERRNMEEFKKWLKMSLDMPNNTVEDRKAHEVALLFRRMTRVNLDNEEKETKN